MRVAMIMALVATMWAGAPAQTLPTTAPATAPSDFPASTPKEALRSLNLALRDGNAAAVRSLFQTGDEQGAKLISAMADYSAALVSLHKASEKRYGLEGANVVTGDIDAQSAEGLAAIEKAEVHVTGATAVVKFGGATDPPVTLVKIDGRWKLPLSQLLDGADKVAEQRRLKELTAQAEVARKTAAEIAAGKYREGATKAAEVWRSRLLEPSTKPSSRPS